MKVYYAHPMSWYGTEREAADVAAILRDTPNGTEVVNPALVDLNVVSVYREGEPDRRKLSGAEAMQVFIGMVEQADAIAYRSFDDDRIGAGVAQEVLVAALHGKQIFRIMDLSTRGQMGPVLFEQVGLRAAFGPKVLTIIETRDRIKRGVM